jgi:hypothetical protein
VLTEHDLLVRTDPVATTNLRDRRRGADGDAEKSGCGDGRKSRCDLHAGLLNFDLRRSIQGA